MSTAIRVPIDGLSRCLCPFLDSIIPSTHRRSRYLIIRTGRRPQINPCQAPRPFGSLQRRAYSELKEYRPISTGLPHPVSIPNNEYPEYEGQSIEELHELLRSAPSRGDNAYEKTSALVRYLIRKRGDVPSLIHYNALVCINADAKLGSAEVVEELLAEMKSREIMGDSRFYHNVLQTLAIHPNYILRSQILEEMKERWVSMTPSGYHFLILGLLRDHQYEMALSTLQSTIENGITIPPHIYDIITYTLLNIPELDTALTLVQSRVANQGTSGISANLWYYMLSVYASAFHYPGVKYIWQQRVELNYTNPSDGICTSILNTAARYNDPMLATDVIRVLANRKVRIDIHHYEALLEAYLGAEDIRTAIRILCIMKKAKLEPDGASTRSIVLWLREPENEHYLNKAWGILKSLQREGHSVPTAAGNAVLEALVSRDKFDEAMRAYKELHLTCSSGADIETFNVLLKGVRATQKPYTEKKALAMFLAAELGALDLKPSELTYDRLILVCLNQYDEKVGVSQKHERGRESGEAEYEDAFRYYDEMKRTGGARGWKLRAGTYKAMVMQCASREPGRAWGVVEDMERVGLQTGALRSLIERIGGGLETADDWAKRTRGRLEYEVGGGR